MSWNGSGTFSRTNGTHTGSSTWVQDRDAGDYILASRHDTHDQDLADGINACLTKNNETKPTAAFRPNADATYDIGSSSLRWANAFFSGAVGIGVTSPSAKLEVADGTNAAGSYTLANSCFRIGSTLATNGSELRGWADSTNYVFALQAVRTNSGSDNLWLQNLGGSLLVGPSGSRIAMTSGLITAADGSATFPAYSFESSGNNDTGMYLSAANELSWATAGSQSMKLTSGATGGLTVTGTGSAIPMPAFANTAITMNTGYTNDSCVLSKDPAGVVHVRGVAYKDSVASGALLYMTLASGYRPAATVIVPVLNTTDGFLRCQIATNGQVTVTHTSSNNANTYFNISFPTT